MKALMFVPLILAAAVALAQAEEAAPDLIEGYRTGDFVPMLPGKVLDLQLLETQATPEKHSLRAQYRAADQSSLSDVLIYAPQGQAIEDDAAAVGSAVADVEKVLAGRGLSPARHQITSSGGEAMSCISAPQADGKSLYSYCAAVAKGRLIAVQVTSQLNGQSADQARAHADAFAAEMVDTIATAA